MFTKKVGNITMYENVKIIRSDRSAPLGAEFVGETVCDGKYLIERNSSDVLSLEYIVAGKERLKLTGRFCTRKRVMCFCLPREAVTGISAMLPNRGTSTFSAFSVPLRMP